MEEAKALDWSDKAVIAESRRKCKGVNDLAIVNGKELSQLMVACLHGDPKLVKDLLESPGINIGLQNAAGSHALFFACGQGNTEVIHMILDACSTSQEFDMLNLQDSGGWSPLMTATANGNVKAVSTLLRHGAKVNMQTEEGISSLLIASVLGYTEIASLLLENGADINLVHGDDKRTSLMAAAQEGHKEIVSLLLKNGAEVDTQTSDDGATALVMASIKGSTDVASLLLQNGAKVDLACTTRSTALMTAAQLGHKNTVTLLLKYGAEVDKQRSDGWTALLLATRTNKAEVVDVLLQHGADIDIKMSNGWTPLLLVSQTGAAEAALVLLRHGAKVNAQRSDGWSALMFAAGSGHSDIVSVMLQHGGEVDMQKDDELTSLMLAAMNGHRKTVSVLLEHGANVNFQKKNGFSVLMGASRNGRWKIVTLLLQHGAKVNVQEMDGWTALMYASRHGHLQTALQLLQNGADPNLESTAGEMCLALASKYNHVETVSVLIEHGAKGLFPGKNLILAAGYDHSHLASQLIQKGMDVDKLMVGGYTLVMTASYFGNTSFVSLLLQKGANVNRQADNGKSALMMASLGDHPDTIAMLLRHGANIEMQDREKRTSLMIASQEGQSCAVSKLLQNNATIDLHDTNHSSSLTLAIERNHARTVSLLLKALLDRDADISKYVKPGTQVIMKAVEYNFCEVVMGLLLSGADVDFRGTDQVTPLMAARTSEMADLLLENGATLDLQDSVGSSALIHAVRKKRFSISELLLRRGANPNLRDNLGNSAVDDLRNAYKELVPSGKDTDLMKIIVVLMKKNGEFKLPMTLCDDPSLVCEAINITRGSFKGLGFRHGHSELGLMVTELLEPSRCKKLCVGDVLWKINRQSVLKHLEDKIPAIETEKRAIFIFVRASPRVVQASPYQLKVEEVRRILGSESVSVNHCEFESSKNLSGKFSALMVASEEGRTEIVKLLIEKWNADVDLRTEDGWTALVLAAMNGHQDVVQLLSQKADVNLQTTDDKMSALMLACREGHYEVAKLLSHNANIDMQTRDGTSALMFASREGHLKVVELLLDRGASIDLQDKKKWSALMMASEKNHREVVEMLLQKQAQVNLRKEDQGFALKIASQHGNHEVVERLIEKHADVNMQNNKGWTSLMSASKEGHSKVVEILLDKNAKVDLQNQKGFSALMTASEEGHSDVAKLLVDKGANLDLTSSKGDSALTLAVINRHQKVISVAVNQIALKEKEAPVEETPAAPQDIPFPSNAIALTLNSLNLIKWRDSKGKTNSFHLVTKANKKWKRIGMLLQYNMAEFEAIKKQQEGDDELCWCFLMEKWLLAKGSADYPATWEGLHSLLLDVQAEEAAKLLKNAVCNAIHPRPTLPPKPALSPKPPPAPKPAHLASNKPSSPSSTPPSVVRAENKTHKHPTEKPAYDEMKQQILFRDSRPSIPPKQGTNEFKVLQDFCKEVHFIIQAVKENEYQAAVTLMDPPEGGNFSKVVVFPRAGTVLGMLADKKIALIHTDEGSDCSDYVQDAIETFPNAMFVVGIGVGYAFDSHRHKLGDVLVSKQISDFKNFKITDDNRIIDRGQRVDMVKDLSSIFCRDLMHEKDVAVSDTKRCSKVNSGLFVSLAAIVENTDIRNKIRQSLPEAIGGDLEGGELLKFQSRRKIRGVAVIKGVSHYADGRMTEEWEFTAALAALHYAKSKLPYYQERQATPPDTPAPASTAPPQEAPPKETPSVEASPPSTQLTIAERAKALSSLSHIKPASSSDTAASKLTSLLSAAKYAAPLQKKPLSSSELPKPPSDAASSPPTQTKPKPPAKPPNLASAPSKTKASPPSTPPKPPGLAHPKSKLPFTAAPQLASPTFSAPSSDRHRELAFRIVDALGEHEGSKSPKVTIELPFSQSEFDGGLQKCGTKSQLVEEVQHYAISCYQDLSKLLGNNWHFRGLNSKGDFHYVVLKTVDYCFHHTKPVKGYAPGLGGKVVQCFYRRGDTLVFTFEIGFGTPEQFGTDEEIFKAYNLTPLSN